MKKKDKHRNVAAGCNFEETDPFFWKTKKTGLENETSAQRAIQSLAGPTLTLLSSYQAACRTTEGVCRTVDHSMASIFCGHAEKHIIKWSASSVSLVLEQKRAQTRHSLKQKKRIKSWSMELQMLQILQLAVWDFVFCSKSSTSAWRRMIKEWSMELYMLNSSAYDPGLVICLKSWISAWVHWRSSSESACYTHGHNNPWFGGLVIRSYKEVTRHWESA